MNTNEILRQIDAEISRLQRARDLFAGRGAATARRTRRKAGRPAARPPAARKRRRISAEGRARIAAAQKRRWAKQKQAKAQG
jgi:hypothetical protein